MRRRVNMDAKENALRIVRFGSSGGITGSHAAESSVAEGDGGAILGTDEKPRPLGPCAYRSPDCLRHGHTPEVA